MRNVKNESRIRKKIKLKCLRVAGAVLHPHISRQVEDSATDSHLQGVPASLGDLENLQGVVVLRVPRSEGSDAYRT